MVDRRIRLEKHAERAVTQPEIEQGLIHLGVRAGDTVFFHSSLSSVGYVINGADAVIDAFLAVVGPRAPWPSLHWLLKIEPVSMALGLCVTRPHRIWVSLLRSFVAAQIAFAVMTRFTQWPPLGRVRRS